MSERIQTVAISVMGISGPAACVEPAAGRERQAWGEQKACEARPVLSLRQEFLWVCGAASVSLLLVGLAALYF